MADCAFPLFTVHDGDRRTATDNPGETLGSTYGSEGWGFNSLRARYVSPEVSLRSRELEKHTVDVVVGNYSRQVEVLEALTVGSQ